MKETTTSAATAETQGRQPGCRLLFLKQFMAAMDITINDAADIVGCTRHTISRWLLPSYDDAPLSSVMSLFDGCGYELDFVLTKEHDAGLDEDIQWRRRNRAQFKADRLAFLSRMMMKYNITSHALGEKLGLYYTTVDHMFRANDMMVSRIYRIADACDMNIFITVKPAEANVYKKKKNYCTTMMTVVVEKPASENGAAGVRAAAKSAVKVSPDTRKTKTTAKPKKTDTTNSSK